MEIDIVIDKTQNELKVILIHNESSEELEDILEILKNKTFKTTLLQGYKNNELKFLKPNEIINIYSENKKIFIKTFCGIYQIKKNLHEIEEILENYNFIRISNSEIINIDKIIKMNFKISGTICII